MKNYSKRKRNIKSYKDTDSGKYLCSKNKRNVDELKSFQNKSLDEMEKRLNFLKKARSSDKVLLQKCQNLIASKKKQQ